MARTKSKRGCTRQARQRELFRRGGKRRGAGRKPKGARAGERHQARPDFKPTHALHVVVRVAPAVGSLRRRKLYKAMRDATITAALREWFRIVHISLQRNHVHLLVEAEHKAALSRGMQGFLISAARHINTAPHYLHRLRYGTPAGRPASPPQRRWGGPRVTVARRARWIGQRRQMAHLRAVRAGIRN